MVYSIPYSFIPGTKARAQEVNANFKYVLDTADEINTNKLNTSLSNITPEAVNVIKNYTSFRNIGEIIQSTGTLTDAGLHLLDGTLLTYGSYSGFIDYISELYDTCNCYNSNAFIKVGSPAITEDGILSDVTTYDYIYTPNIDFSGANSWVIYTPVFNFEDLSSGIHTVLYSTINQNGLSVFVRANGKTSWGVWENLGDENPIFKRDANTTIVEDTDYQIKIIFTGNQYEFYLSANGGEFILTDTYVSSVKTYVNAPIYVGRGNGQILTNGYLDVKSFSVYINGIKTFSGNKSIYYFTDEASWQNSVSQYGYCKKFVYDSVNNTVRLPKYIYEADIDADAGDLAKYLYYIVVATSLQTDIQVDIDEIATDLNAKADKDLTNVEAGAFEHVINTAQQSGKSAVINWVLPDYTAGVSVSAGSYTPAYDCFAIGTMPTSSSRVQVQLNSAYLLNLVSGSQYEWVKTSGIYLLKGVTYTVTLGGGATLISYPLKGENYD